MRWRSSDATPKRASEISRHVRPPSAESRVSSPRTTNMRSASVGSTISCPEIGGLTVRPPSPRNVIGSAGAPPKVAAGCAPTTSVPGGTACVVAQLRPASGETESTPAERE